MKLIGRLLGSILNFFRLQSARCLIGCLFFLAAYAVSGRGIWLVLAAGSVLIAMAAERSRRWRIGMQIRELPVFGERFTSHRRW